MYESEFFLWLAMIFPLVFSAGPANIAMASFGGRFGLIKSLPFISGINLIVFLQAILIGFGAGAFIEKYPILFKYLQYAGSIYLIYLALKLFNSSKTDIKESLNPPPCFVEGVILQLLNMKVMTVMIIMFSRFLDITSNQIVQVVMLSLGITTLTTGATITWAASGAWLIKKLASKKSIQLQGYFFGSMLVIVAIWMLI